MEIGDVAVMIQRADQFDVWRDLLTNRCCEVALDIVNAFSDASPVHLQRDHIQRHRRRQTIQDVLLHLLIGGARNRWPGPKAPQHGRNDFDVARLFQAGDKAADVGLCPCMVVNQCLI